MPGKEPACQCRRCKRPGFDPCIGNNLRRRTWQPIPVFLSGESHGQRSLEGYSPWGRKESDTTEATTHTLGGGEETREEVKEGENASKVNSCLRLEGTSEQHRTRQKQFINTGTLGGESQSSQCLNVYGKRATELR